MTDVMPTFLGAYFPRELSRDYLASPQEFLFKKRILYLYEIIDGVMSRPDAFGPTMVMESLLALDSISHEPIKLIISSPGGDVASGFMLYDTIRAIESPVWSIGRNLASMATVLFAAGERGHRYLHFHSRVMLHKPFGHVTGDSDEIQIRTKEIVLTKQQLVDCLIECGAVKEPAEILKDIATEFWLSAEETIAYGIADQKISKGFWGTV